MPKWIYNNKIVIPVGGVILGVISFLIIFFHVHITIPGTNVITDPREVFVLISAALFGPIGGSVTALLASLYDQNSQLIPYIVAQHIFPALIFSYLYRNFVYKKLAMPTFLLGWIGIVFLYYFVFYLPIYYLTYYVFPDTFALISGGSISPYFALKKIFAGFVPEFLYTSVMTSLIWVALPKRLRKPLDVKITPEYTKFQLRLDNFVHHLGLANNFLGLRLTVWFIIFSTIPLSFGALSVRTKIVDLLKEVEIKNRIHSVEEIINYYDLGHKEHYHNFDNALKIGNYDYIFVNDENNINPNNLLADYGKVILKIRNNEIKFNKPVISVEIDGDFYVLGKVKTSESIIVKKWTEDEYQIAIDEFQRYAAIIVVLSILIVGFLSSFTIWLIVSRPLNLLSITANEISKGNLGIRADTRFLYDEMATLGDAFNNMTEKLKAMIEENRKAKLNAENSNKLKNQFLAQISHEIRTPLNGILNAVYFLTENVDESEYEKIFAKESVVRSLDRITRTIDSLIYKTELELDLYQPTKEDVDLVKNVIIPIADKHRMAMKKNIKLTVIAEDKSHLLYTDSTALDVIFDNLIDNAVKFTDEGEVTIKVEDKGDYIRCLIKDTGIGISESFLPFVFEPFRQEDQGYSRAFDGNGLG
ncbi:MAG: sensor histidine kinase, partial [Ignavibacteria bacterium]